MDLVVKRTVDQDYGRVCLGLENFTNLVHNDDVSLFAAMLQVLQLSPEVLTKESKAFRLEVNWFKTKLQYAATISTSM